MDFTAASQSPTQFRLWSGIAMIAAALERRVWARSGKYVTYPNLYVMLVANPGIGKQVIEEARGVFQHIRMPNTTNNAFKVASDSATRASLIDELARSKTTFQVTGGDPPLVHSSMAVFSEEFRVLLPAYDQDFISRLDKLYNGGDKHDESRRTGTQREVKIENPLLNLLAGAQPAYLADTFPENAWATGICRRLIMVHAAEGPFISIFDEPTNIDDCLEQMDYLLAQMSQLYGHVKWHPESVLLVREFETENHKKNAGLQDKKLGHWPQPDHTRLVHYNRSRTMMVIKLGIVAAIAARCEMMILPSDLHRAIGWLLQAEATMPDIFREMRGRSDYEVMIEVHRYVMGIWGTDKASGVGAERIFNFIQERVPSEKVERIFSLMEKSAMLSRIAGTDKFVPKPVYEHKKTE